MTMNRALVTFLLPAAFALLFAGPAAASLQAPPIPYTLTQEVGDADGDGHQDAKAGIAGGYPCGCYCQVWTVHVHLEAAGQEADGHYVSGCTTDSYASYEGGAVDPLAPTLLDPDVDCWGPNCVAG